MCYGSIGSSRCFSRVTLKALVIPEPGDEEAAAEVEEQIASHTPRARSDARQSCDDASRRRFGNERIHVGIPPSAEQEVLSFFDGAIDP